MRVINLAMIATEMHKTTSYRSDIDGLRALAILPVIFFHAFPQLIHGGFTGVDVFFVISGYLITGIISKDINSNSFSFIEFYMRRIRRIFPALLLVLICCLIAGWLFMFNGEFQQLGKHVSSGSIFISNFALLSESGYFDSASDSKPLLHLWSLSIEEQFYLIWPLIVWAAYKTTRRPIVIISLTFALSLAASLIAIKISPAGAFYLPFTRFWELAAGGILSQLISTNHTQHSSQSKNCNTVAVGAILLLIAGYLFINPGNSFPGFWALIPVVAAAALIGPARGSWINTVILSHPLMRWFGLISFPLYLWHWPLLTFLRTQSGLPATAFFRLAALVLSVVLAWLTWLLLERIMQRGPLKRTSIGLLGAMVVVGAVSILIQQPNIANTRYGHGPSGEIGHDAFFEYLDVHARPCEDSTLRAAADTYKGHERCKQSKAGTPVTSVLIGDSHAEQLFIGISASTPKENLAFYVATGLPILSNKAFKEIFTKVTTDPNIHTVIIAARWQSRASEIPAASSLETELLASAQLLLDHGKKVFIINDNANFPFEPLNCLRSKASNTPKCSITLSDARLKSSKYDAQLVSVSAKDPRVSYIDQLPAFCDQNYCSMLRQGSILYRDNNHMNATGSVAAGKYIVEQMHRAVLPN